MLCLYSQACLASSSASLPFSSGFYPRSPFFTSIPFFSPGGYLICCIPCFPFHEQKTCIWASFFFFSLSLSLTSFPKFLLFMEKRKRKKKERTGGRMLKGLGDESGFYIVTRGMMQRGVERASDHDFGHTGVRCVRQQLPGAKAEHKPARKHSAIQKRREKTMVGMLGNHSPPARGWADVTLPSSPSLFPGHPLR